MGGKGKLLQAGSCCNHELLIATTVLPANCKSLPEAGQTTTILPTTASLTAR
jgi:hypothetical protein